MKAEPATGFALLVLAAGMAASAVLGPLVSGMIEFHVSRNMVHQLVGGEIVSLLIAAPVALAAGVLWLRRHPLASVLAMAPALYAVYTYPQFIVGPQYERYGGNNELLFPLYLALIVLGWVVALRAWIALGAVKLPSPSMLLRRTLGTLLIVLSVIIAVAWTASLTAVVADPSAVAEYQSDPTLFWLIRMMDLAFVVPAALITGVGLLRRAPWATRLGYAFTGFQVLLVAAVACMAAVMAIRDDPAASPALLAVTGTMMLALAIVYGRLLRHTGKAPGYGVEG